MQIAHSAERFSSEHSSPGLIDEAIGERGYIVDSAASPAYEIERLNRNLSYMWEIGCEPRILSLRCQKPPASRPPAKSPAKRDSLFLFLAWPGARLDAITGPRVRLATQPADSNPPRSADSRAASRKRSALTSGTDAKSSAPPLSSSPRPSRSGAKLPATASASSTRAFPTRGRHPPH